MKKKNSPEEVVDKEQEETLQEEVNTVETDGVEQTSQTEPSEEEKLRNELKDLNDKYIRLYSDFDNYRRRAAKEKLEMIKMASENVVLALLPILDDFERALLSTVQGGDGLKMSDLEDKMSEQDPQWQGSFLIYQKLYKVLQQQGVEKMEVLHQVFDSATSEAIAQVPVEDKSKKGKVMDVISQGYKMGEKVIRFAKVVVGA